MERGKKEAGGKKKPRIIERRKCPECGRSYRLLPDDQIPYKHYSAEIIEKVIDEDYDFAEDELLEMEDYPCEATKARWRKWAEQLEKNAEGQVRSAGHRILGLPLEILSHTGSLLRGIKERIRWGWLPFIIGIMISTGGAGTLPEPP